MDKGITAIQSDTIAKVYFTVQGIGTLISWNGILTGLDYFSDRYKNYEASFLLPLGFNAAQVMANFFIPKLGVALSLKTRILTSLIIISCVLVFLPVEANLMSETNTGFWVIMGLLFILGFFNCAYQATISGFASKFPGKYTSYFLMGGGLAGLTMNVLRAIAILSFSNVAGGDLIEILVYFGVAGLFLIICMMIHPLFTKSYFCRYYLGQTSPRLNVSEDQTTQATGSEPLLESEQQLGKSAQGFKTILSVLGEVKLYVLLLILGYTQSFLVFPGVMLEKPMNTMDGSWKVVSMLATFNFCDVIGKNLAQYRNKYSKNTVIWIIILRTSFVAFFIIQAITSSIAVFNTMWFGYINIALFGLTSGFLTSALFILGPESVEGWKKEIAGFLSVFGLTTGLTLGGLFALLLKNLNTHNP